MNASRQQVSTKQLRQALLDSAKYDTPSPNTVRKARAAVLAGSAAAIGLSTASTASSATSAAIVLKWLAIGVVGGLATVATIHAASPGHAIPSREQSMAVQTFPERSVPTSDQHPEVPAPQAAVVGPMPRIQHSPATQAVTSAPTAPSSVVVLEPSPPEASGLAEEVQALDEARHALSQNEPNEALRLLGQYGHRFPKQRLAHEATFLRIQALMAQGDQLGARAAAESFIRTNPSSPLVPRLQALFGQ